MTKSFIDSRIQVDDSCNLVAVVECFGLWNDDLGWLALESGTLFWTSSKAVAQAMMQREKNESFWRVRSFDEWAESEGLK